MDADGFGTEIGEEFAGFREEEIAGQDCDRVIPPLVGGRGAAAQLGFVHDIVVIERGEVGEFDHHGRFDHIRVGGVGAEVAGQDGQQGAEALAAGVDEVA